MAEDITADCTKAFRMIESKQPAKAWIAKQPGNALAWTESYRLMAYVAMYEGSGDVAYLDAVMGRFEEILKIRDDKRKVKDKIRGRIVPAWSSTKHTGGKRYAWIVHAGMITYPIARCAYLIRRDPKLKRRYGTRADRYVKAVEETVHAFDKAWRENKSKKEGWYHGDYLKKGLPLNMQNAMGRTLVALWLATGKDEYRAKAKKLARFFRNRLKHKGKGYVWSYWPNGRGAEDISHAAINVDFAFTCYRANIVFTKDDMMKFAQTLRTCRKKNGFTKRADGSGDLSASVSMGRWGHLGFVDKEVRSILHGYFMKKWEPSRLYMTSAAYLVETQATLTFDKVASRP